MSDEVDANKVVEMAQNWVRAEHCFRHGPGAYTAETQEWYERAERKLRRALTGKGNLQEAFQRLGSDDAGTPDP